MNSIEAERPSYQIINEPNWAEALQQLERAARTCYKSEESITPESAEKLIRSVIKRGHESVLEHISFSVRFICDRGVSHELVRHRHCAFSQESTRYVNYGKSRVQFILPPWIGEVGEADCLWLETCNEAETAYNKLLELGWTPQQARSVLPNSLKTEIVVTANLREWRHIFHLRCDKTAHPQMRELMLPLYEELKEKAPAIFDSVRFSC